MDRPLHTFTYWRRHAKSVVVKAVLLTEENFYAVGDWAGVTECWDLGAPIPALHIYTPEGIMKAFIGDYVVKDVGGEFYSCKPDIFKVLYAPTPI
jgi:hypothetical protein